MSGVNHSLAFGELSLLLCLAVSSALHILPLVWVYVSELYFTLSARSHDPEHDPCIIHVHVALYIALVCPGPVTSSHPSSYLWPLEDVPRDSPRGPDAVVDYVRERTVSWCRLRITPYTIQIGIAFLKRYRYIYIHTHTARNGYTIQLPRAKALGNHYSSHVTFVIQGLSYHFLKDHTHLK